MEKKRIQHYYYIVLPIDLRAVETVVNGTSISSLYPIPDFLYHTFITPFSFFKLFVSFFYHLVSFYCFLKMLYNWVLLWPKCHLQGTTTVIVQ